jgi:integrase/recombinase XerD
MPSFGRVPPGNRRSRDFRLFPLLRKSPGVFYHTGMSKKLPRLLRDDEPERLLNATTRQRDRLLLLVLLYTGLRVAELCSLRVEHLDFGAGTLAVFDGKGGRDRMVPLASHLLAPLRGWLGPRCSGFVFPSRQGGGRLTTRAVEYLFTRLAIRAKLDNPRRAHPHAFRHVFATRLLRNGANIRVVQKLLGHQQLSTTEIYLDLSDRDLFDAVNLL